MITKLKKLYKHEGFIKYSTNTSWLLLEKILRIILGLFVAVWVARYLGPEKYGIFSYALSFVALFTTIATLGLDEIVVRELVKDEGVRNELIGTVFWLKLMGAFAMLAVLTIAVNFTSNDTNTNTLIFIIASATIFQSFNVVDMYFQSIVLSKYVVYANIISLLTSSIVKIVLILNEAQLIAFAWVVLFDSIVLASGFIFFYIKNNSTFKIEHLKFSKSIAFNLLQECWPLVLSGIAIMVYMKIDQIMIKEMMGPEAVGQYAAAVKLSEAWYFMPVVIASSLFPAIINAKKQSTELYYERLQKLYDFVVWMAIAIALPMTFLGDWLVELLYGGGYNEAGSVLVIHIWAGVVVFFGAAWSKWMVNENQQLIIMKLQVIAMVNNIILNIFLIPLYGIKGAALATLLSYTFGHTIFALFFKNQKIAIKMLLRSIFFIKKRSVLEKI